MFFSRHLPLMLPLAVGLALAHQGVAASPAPSFVPANVAEFGVVTLDISGAKTFSDSIPEKKTIKNIKKSTAQGAMRFREGASGIYRVRTIATGKRWENQGTMETTVSIEISRPDGTLRFTARGSRCWSVPADVTDAWAQPDEYEPRFRGPNAKKDGQEWRDNAAQRMNERLAQEQGARESYRFHAVGEAFRDSLRDAREAAENQLQKSLQKVTTSPTPKP